MTEGRINIINATPFEAAQAGPGNGANGTPKRDPDAGWHMKNDSRGVRSLSMDFLYIQVLMKIVLSIGKASHLGMFTTVRSVIR